VSASASTTPNARARRRAVPFFLSYHPKKNLFLAGAPRIQQVALCMVANEHLILCFRTFRPEKFTSRRVIPGWKDIRLNSDANQDVAELRKLETGWPVRAVKFPRLQYHTVCVVSCVQLKSVFETCSSRGCDTTSGGLVLYCTVKKKRNLLHVEIVEWVDQVTHLGKSLVSLK
jgi:hypothetical protein